MSAIPRLVLVRFVEGEEEGVGHAFAGDVGAWAVAGDDRNRAFEGDELSEDAFHEHFVVATGVVGATDGAGEEGVAAEEDLFGRFIEGNAARSVARGLDDLETEPADLDDGDAFRAIRTVGAAVRRTQTFGTMVAIRTVGAALGRTIGAAGRRCISAVLGWIFGTAIATTVGAALGRIIRTALGRTIGTTLRRAGLADVDCFEGCGKGSAEPFGEIFISGEGRFVGRVHVDREIIIVGNELGDTEDMVEMSMSQHDTYRLEASGGDERCQLGDLGVGRAAGVDDGA